MKYTDNEMSAILLCSYIGIDKTQELKPLSLGEWNDFLERVIQAKLEPSVVLKDDDLGTKLSYPEEFIQRVKQLAERGVKVALELEMLHTKGIGVVTLFSKDYPTLLKRKLKRKTPPVLFFAGDLQLAKKVGIAVVGSRNVDELAIEFTKKLAKMAAAEKLIVYSGGARGVDTISEQIAMQEGGAVVSYIADSLISKIKKKDVVEDIMAGRLLLLSDVKPDAGFTAARAMNRNKFIYASAYGAFVVQSDYNKGGTWSGATEAIRHDLTKVLVWNNPSYEGNEKLIEKGGISFDFTDEKLYDVITKEEVGVESVVEAPQEKESYHQMDMFQVMKQE